MNSLQRGILNLIKACIKGDRAKLEDDFDWKAACDVGKKHSIVPMIYYGALSSELSLPDNVFNFLKIETMKSIYVDQNQLYETNRIEQEFVKNGIEYLPLKGMTLKHKYPHTEARVMADADILIKTAQYDAIRTIMQALGYDELGESDHEFLWDKSSSIHIEFHKRLIPSYNKDYYAYFGDGWQFAHRTESTKYEMFCEDEFIYLFVHYAKHFRDGGIGIRHLTDLYVFLSSFNDIDMGYIERQLKKLGLIDFYKNSMETLNVWYCGNKDTEMSDFVTDMIFRSGSYGTSECHVLSEGVKIASTQKSNNVKVRKFLNTAFPPTHALENNYPILKKCKLLLPFVWCCRGIRIVLFERRKVKENIDQINLLSEEKLSNYKSELDFVGLKFDFKE